MNKKCSKKCLSFTNLIYFYFKGGTEGDQGEPPKTWIWIVIAVLVCCVLAVIGVWLYIKKKKSGGSGGGGQQYQDVPQDAK